MMRRGLERSDQSGSEWINNSGADREHHIILRKLKQLGARKVYQRKQCGTRRENWKRGTWEKHVEEERGDDGKLCDKDCRIATGGDEKSGGRDTVC